MTTVISAREVSNPLLSPIAKFSPDGTKFVVILRKGDVATNTNEFSIMLWRENEIFENPTPQKLLTMRSDSSRAAIQDITWLDDNDTLLFMGEQPGEVRQLYSFNISTRSLKRLTDSPRNLLAYSTTPKADQIVYKVDGPTKALFDTEQARREGLIVSKQYLLDLLLNKGGIGPIELFTKKVNGEVNKINPIGTMRDVNWEAPLLSPDGRYILMITRDGDSRDWRKDYTAPQMPLLLPGMAYRLIDTATGANSTLLQSPAVDFSTSAVWAPDSQSVILSGVFLPLDGQTGDERKARQGRSFSVEVQIPHGEITKIGGPEQDLRVRGWDARTGDVTFDYGKLGSYKYDSRLVMKKQGTRWVEISANEETASPEKVVLEESMNAPPEILGIDSVHRKKALLLDPNPQFRRLQFGRVEEIRWKAKDGHEVKGGLYYPVGYISGKRYPLVIQTHGWSGPLKFRPDGIFPSGYAAQPLAGKGIMVLQSEEDGDFNTMAKYNGTPAEVERAVGAYEGAIDYLNQQGLIDTNLVGLMGFSRTCLYVKYAITHSSYHFAAASIFDGVDGGYFQYIINLNVPSFTQFEEGINGGVPFGSGLKSWIERSPAFKLDNVRVPLRIVAPRLTSVPGEWEWFAGLSRLGRPVELVVMQDGVHEVQRPWERMISSEGNADWFAYWLKNEQDPSPEKRNQYERWRAMKPTAAAH